MGTAGGGPAGAIIGEGERRNPMTCSNLISRTISRGLFLYTCYPIQHNKEPHLPPSSANSLSPPWELKQGEESREMGFCVGKAETLLRAISCLLLVLTACLVALDSQTKYIVYTYARKATYKDLNGLSILVYVDGAAAAYNFFQLGRCSLRPCRRGNKSELPPPSDRKFLYLTWVLFMLDQVSVYIVFGATVAATQASMLVLTGSKILQWMKLCDRYTRFCVQIGGALICGYVASVAMGILSFISAYNLFRLYSPTKFMQLKNK